MQKGAQSVELIEPLLKSIKNKLLLWAQQRGMERAIIARPDERELAVIQKQLPVGTTIERRPLKGRRISVKGPRDYANRSTRTAHWPEDAMQSRRISNLICVLSGQADLQIGNHLLHCQEGDLLFLLPGTPFPDGSRPHLEGPRRGERHCDILWITSSGIRNTLGCWICHSQGDQHFERPLESCLLVDQQSIRIYEALMQEVVLERARGNAICGYLLSAMLISMVESMEGGHFFQFSYQMEIEEKKSNRDDPIQRAEEYIRGHLHKHLTINDVAQHVYLSRTQFTRLFREQTGKSFIDFLTECRLHEAQRLLNNSQWSVTMICQRVGVTPSRLRSIFQQYMGMSPAEYRMQSTEKSKARTPRKKIREPVR